MLSPWSLEHIAAGSEYIMLVQLNWYIAENHWNQYYKLIFFYESKTDLPNLAFGITGYEI